MVSIRDGVISVDGKVFNTGDLIKDLADAIDYAIALYGEYRYAESLDWY